MSGLREEIRDELAGWPIGSGYYQDKVGTDDAAEMADALLPLIERHAAARAAEELRAAAAELPYAPAPRTDWLRARAAALDGQAQP